jgi:uncharacterized OB-fold protein
VSERPSVLGDPLTTPFWAAAQSHQFMLQRCRGCAQYQFYPRPFCLRCGSAEVEWAPASGRGVIYAQTTIHLSVIPELEPPYVVALVELDEGPRYTAGIVGPSVIGDRVRLTWRDRHSAPPLPMFTREEDREQA